MGFSPAAQPRGARRCCPAVAADARGAELLEQQPEPELPPAVAVDDDERFAGGCAAMSCTTCCSFVAKPRARRCCSREPSGTAPNGRLRMLPASPWILRHMSARPAHAKPCPTLQKRERRTSCASRSFSIFASSVRPATPAVSSSTADSYAARLPSFGEACPSRRGRRELPSGSSAAPSRGARHCRRPPAAPAGRRWPASSRRRRRTPRRTALLPRPLIILSAAVSSGLSHSGVY